MFPRCEMLDLVVIDGKARGIVTRHLVTGNIESFSADAVVLATGGYGNVYFLSTNAIGCNVSATYRAYKRGAAFANPCFTQIHPTCIPVSGDHQSKLTLMSESLRNDGRVWVPKNKGDLGKHPNEIPEAARDYFLERKYPSYGNLAPRDIASRAAKEACDDGRGVGPGGRGVYLDFADAIRKQGKDRIADKYGNLFEMYERITDEDAYSRPMRIYPAVHYTMGGLWVNYELCRICRVSSSLARRTTRTTARTASVLSAHAGPCRRLLRAAIHDHQLARGPKAGRAGRPIMPSSNAAKPRPWQRSRNSWR